MDQPDKQFRYIKDLLYRYTIVSAVLIFVIMILLLILSIVYRSRRIMIAVNFLGLSLVNFSIIYICYSIRKSIVRLQTNMDKTRIVEKTVTQTTIPP